MKLDYSFVALVLLMPMCIGYAYQSKQHWRGLQAAERVTAPNIAIEPETPNLAAPTIQVAPVAVPKRPQSYQEALKVAKAANKDVFLCFSGERFCAPCRQLKITLADVEVQKQLASYVVYIIDVEGSEAVVARQMGITGVPTYMIVNSDGQMKKKGVGYKTPASFIRWLTTTKVADAYMPYDGPGKVYFCDTCQVWHYAHPVAHRAVNVVRWLLSPRYRHSVWRQRHIYQECL